MEARRTLCRDVIRDDHTPAGVALIHVDPRGKRPPHRPAAASTSANPDGQGSTEQSGRKRSQSRKQRSGAADDMPLPSHSARSNRIRRQPPCAIPIAAETVRPGADSAGVIA
jgi:hypothetical protein